MKSAGIDTQMQVQAATQGSGVEGFEALSAAVAASNINELADYCQGFDLKEYPATTTLKQILANLSDCDESDIGDDAFEMTSGDGAVHAFADRMRDGAQYDDGDDAAKAAVVYNNVADATERVFLPSTKFASVQLASHEISEDGDTEQQILLAKRNDGSWLVLAYDNNPF
jgi:hypothetical protein